MPIFQYIINIDSCYRLQEFAVNAADNINYEIGLCEFPTPTPTPLKPTRMYLPSFFQSFIIINLLLNLESLQQSVHAVLVPLPLCFSSSDLLFLGTGPALYFNYLLVCICAILIPTLGYSIVCVISNFENSKQSISSQNNLILSLSNVTSPSAYSQIHSYILAACNLILVIFIPIAVKIGLRALNKAYSSQLMFYYPQSLALLIKLERPANYTEEEVKKVINQWYHVQMKIAQKTISDQQAKIVEKVYFNFDMQAYGVLTQQIEQLQKQKNRYDEEYMHLESSNIHYMGKDSKRSFSSPSQHSQAAKHHHRIDKLKQKIKNRQLQKTNKLIVVLNKIEHVQLLRTKLNTFYKKHINKLVFPADNNAQVNYAPFPSQIRFDHLHMSSPDKFRRRVMSWVGTGVLVGVGVAIEYLCLFVIRKYLWDNDPGVCPVILAIVCYSVSALMIVVSNKLVLYKLHSTKTNEDNSKCYHSLAIFLFLRCIAIFGIFLIHEPIGSNSTYFAQTVTWLMLIWSVFMTITKFINFSIIGYCFHMVCLSPNFQDKNVSQAQINAKFEKPENKLYENYSEYCSFIFASFSFASIAPLCLITCSILLIICILAERIAFVRVYRQPSPSNHSLFVQMGSILWKSALGLILGHFYLIYFIQSQEVNISALVKIVLYIVLGVNCVLLLVPSRILQPKIESNLSYQHIQNKLLNCYDDFNPIYSVNFPSQPQKEIVNQVSKSERLAQELNTMSKSLQQTLRDKLFNQKNPCLEVLNNREEDSLYFQFDPKVSMPEKKPAKSKVPPIFKQNRADVQFKMINRRTRKSTENLVKLTNLVGSQEQDEIKKRIKTAIKDSINKIK